jgi:hypothetical protein
LNTTLIAFIDNLDRCLPDVAISTLEAIRLFLFMPRTAFVIAADEDMIRHSVAKHFAGDVPRIDHAEGGRSSGARRRNATACVCLGMMPSRFPHLLEISFESR